MLAGLSGTLISGYFAERLLTEQFGTEMDAGGAAAIQARLRRDRQAIAAALGPICGPRQVHDLVTAPLAEGLGHALGTLRPAAHGRLLVAGPHGGRGPAFAAAAWGEPFEPLAREAARAALEAGACWCVCVNGREVRLIDARRSYARRFLQFDLDEAMDDPAGFLVLRTLLGAAAFAVGPAVGPALRPPLIDRVVAASDRNTLAVCGSLRDGVLQALARLLGGLLSVRRRGGLPPLDEVHRQALTVIYRVLFLLFAESRRLVPTWHTLYRDAYSLDSLLAAAERPGPATGLWEALQAIARLSHAGCRAGDLRVTPFNGRLFSPALTPLAESRSLSDEAARQMLLALATTPRRGGYARIVYRDLDVEQLGAVYESVLDYAPTVTPAPSPRVPLSVEMVAGTGERKATASFYTPRALTTYLVRRTLAPLVAGATPEQILALRVVDPAMGSGAFLVAACRFLASEYGAALVRAGRCLPSDIDEHERRRFRRTIVQRCLYGVDLNPTAVQLARLSLWLTSLAPDRPLSFLDHRLVVGNSVVGASLDDVARRPAPGASVRREPRPPAALPLFAPDAIGPALRTVLPDRTTVTERPDDTLEDVRAKEKLVEALSGSRSPLARWRAVLDLWCAGSFFPNGSPMTAGLFAALADHLLTGRSALPPAAAARWLDQARRVGHRLRPLHWTLEFPEVFYAADGSPLQSPGFDAIIGNPPWDMVRADNPGSGGERVRQDIAGLLRFAHDSGVYRSQGGGHANLFQLFVERACQLVRHGGRIGIVVPWGLFSDHGCAPLRRLLFDRSTVDSVAGFDNAGRIFPIHRSVRFVALSATSGGSTPLLRLRLGEHDPAVLDDVPSRGNDAVHFPVMLPRRLLDRLSGDDLAVPDVRRPEDVALLERLVRAAPPLSGTTGWRADFGRELNATDHRRHFDPDPAGLPVLEGKHIGPFRANPSGAALRLPHEAAHRLLDARRTFARARLAYRDVSSATNRLTLIAAVVPAGCVTVHSLFCLRTPLPTDSQLFLCGVLNSLVANYVVRFWVGSHVTTAILERLPVPCPAPGSPALRRVADLSATLSGAEDALAHPAYPVLQAEVARLYGLEAFEVERILGTFPLIDDGVRAAALAAFVAPGGVPRITAPPPPGFRAGSAAPSR